MKRTIIFSSIVLLLIAASLVYFIWLPSRAEQKQTAQKPEEIKKLASNAVAAPGIVEAVSEEIEVGAEIPGKLKQVLVEEGDAVSKGQIIAILENSDLEAQVAAAKTQIETLRRQKESARARLAQAEAERVRIENGARVEERREALMGFEQTTSVVEQARREAARREKLYRAGDISREEFERAARELKTAEAKSAEMRERFNVVNASARADDLEKADAAISLAESQIREFDALIKEAEARVLVSQSALGKTLVRAPISGVILRKRLKDGESVSPENSTSGIVTIADTSVLRVRVDVDETDVGKISENMRAFVVADAFGDKKFYGRVVKIGQILGRKNFRTERPTERVDTKILEVLIELDANQKLPLGLRVDAFIGEQ